MKPTILTSDGLPLLCLAEPTTTRHSGGERRFSLERLSGVPVLGVDSVHGCS